MKEIIKFLANLAANNNREWFAAHKDEYLQVKQRFDAFVELLIGRVRELDPSIGSLMIGDCTWRIYRDTRFSHDKRPYKTNMGCYFAPGGKRGPYSGYYFQLGIADEDGSVQGMIATGNYYTEPAVLKILREDIAFDDAKSFTDAMAHAKGFTLDTEQMLKRPARGFDAAKPYSDLFRYKNFCLIKTVDEDYLTSPDLVDRILDDFSVTRPFLHLLNRAIAYTFNPG